jgi:uroporphyrinogen-III decarboxylase
LHICGDIRHLLPGIAQAGPDLLDCDWMVPLAGARAAMGPKVVLTGNLDPVRAVMQSTPDQIRAALPGLAREAHGPFMIGAGCEIPPGTPPENLKALCTPVA